MSHLAEIPPDALGHDRRAQRAQALEMVRRLARTAEGEPGRQRLREQVIGEYMSYARHIARRFGHLGDRTEDVLQVAYLGLIKAVDNYDPGFGTTFLTYATPMISGEIKRHLRDTTWVAHVPRDIQELTLRLRPAIETLTQRLGRSPNADELAADLDVATADVIDALDAAEMHDAVSLDAPIRDEADSTTLGDLLGDDDDGYDLIVDRQAIKPLLAALPERDKRILLMRFFRNMTQAEIGEQLGVSQMQVSRLLHRILTELRQALNPTVLDDTPNDRQADSAGNAGSSAVSRQER